MAEKLVVDSMIQDPNTDGIQLTRIQRTIFVGGIPLKSTSTEIVDYLLQFDTVESVILPRNKNTGHLRGYAKAVLGSKAGVDRVLAVHHHVIGGLNIGMARWTTTDEYLVKKEDISSRKVYVKFKARIGVDNVHAYFRQFGEIDQFDVKCNAINGRFRDFGYITYLRAEYAQAAINHDSHTISGEEVRCELSKPSSTALVQSGPKLSPDIASEADRCSRRLLDEIEKLMKTENTKTGSRRPENVKTIPQYEIEKSFIELGENDELISTYGGYITRELMKKPQPYREKFSCENSLKKEFGDVHFNFRKIQPTHNTSQPQKSQDDEVFKDSLLRKPTLKNYLNAWNQYIRVNHDVPGNLQFNIHAPTTHFRQL